MDSEVRPSSAHRNDYSQVLLPSDAEELPNFEVIEIQSSEEEIMLNDENIGVQRLEDGDAEVLPNNDVLYVQNSHDASLSNEVIDLISSSDEEIASRSTRPRGVLCQNGNWSTIQGVG